MFSFVSLKSDISIWELQQQKTIVESFILMVSAKKNCENQKYSCLREEKIALFPNLLQKKILNLVLDSCCTILLTQLA